MAKLKKEILLTFKKRLDLEPEDIRPRLAEIRRGTSLTLNAAAQRFAENKGISIMPMLDDVDKQSLTANQKSIIQHIILGKNNKRSRTSLPRFIYFLKYDTDNYFEEKHIDEINKAYNAEAYTAVYMLCRKIIENLIIDLLVTKFPKKRELYFDNLKARFLDFSVIIKNLSETKDNFPVSVHKAIDRLVPKAGFFAKNANERTHSWYYTASKQELIEANVTEIINLIKVIDTAIVDEK